jgi:peptidoglycan/xylan/chitin deacetylase (PgdA/CDA1 family)
MTDTELPFAEQPAAKKSTPMFRGRKFWFALGITIVSLSLVITSIGLAGGFSFLTAKGANSQAVVSTPTLSPSPSPTPTATPIPPPYIEQWNTRVQGCVNGQPPPVIPGVVVTGDNPKSSLPPPNEVALTFDDGPNPNYTPKILDALEKLKVPATFFVEGDYAHLWPDLIHREYTSGFAIGTHSWNHPYATTLSDAQLHQQLYDSMDAVRKGIGADGDKACLWFWRPPYGSYNAHVLQITTAAHLSSINWDDAGMDWERPGAAGIAANVKRNLRPGAIILLHDGPALREQTVESISMIVDIINAAGLKPVTIPQLLVDAHYFGDSVSWPPASYATGS